MVNQSHQFNLPVGTFGMRYVLEWSRKLLDGHGSSRYDVHCGAKNKYKNNIKPDFYQR